MNRRVQLGCAAISASLLLCLQSLSAETGEGEISDDRDEAVPFVGDGTPNPRSEPITALQAELLGAETVVVASVTSVDRVEDSEPLTGPRESVIVEFTTESVLKGRNPGDSLKLHWRSRESAKAGQTFLVALKDRGSYWAVTSPPRLVVDGSIRVKGSMVPAAKLIEQDGGER